MTLPGIVATEPLLIDVAGEPVPKGSMIGLRRGQRVVLVAGNETKLRHWREHVTNTARARAALTDAPRFHGPLAVTLAFFVTRPASVTPTKRPRPSVPPDIDKLARAILDALTQAAVWDDDGQVVELHAAKHYALTTAGVRITIREAT